MCSYIYCISYFPSLVYSFIIIIIIIVSINL